MGLNDRDYARYRPEHGFHRGGQGFSNWEVWKKILAANIAVFVLQIFITRPFTEADLRSDTIPHIDEDLSWDMELLNEELASLREGNAETLPDQDSGKLTSKINETTESEASSGSARDAKAEELLRRRRELAREREQQIQFMPRISLVEEWFQLDSNKLREGQVWRLFTCGFCHDRMGIWHLVFNMLFLYWFGRRLETKYGSREFSLFYFASLLFASLAYVALDVYTNAGRPAIGASGAVWGVTALYALLYPYERINIYFLFPVEIRWLVLLYFLFDLHPVLLSLSGEGMMHSGVGHAAHVGGAVFGFFYWYNRWQLSPIFSRLTSMFAAQPNTRSNTQSNRETARKIHREEQRSASKTDRKEMDRILEKISREGRDSLTDDELRTLEETSRQMRENREHHS